MNKHSSSAIAVIGLSCRFPGAQNARELWENILARRRQFRKIPRCRLPLDEYYDPKASDKTYATRAAVMDLLKFDWVAHRIPKSSYEGTDWVHWLAYQVAIEAVADAGYTRDSIPRRKTGVILGNTLCGEQTRTLGIRLRWPFIARSIEEGASRSGMSTRATRRILTEAESVLKSVFPMLSEDSLAGAMSNTIAGRIASVFDLDGGGYVVDGACASSLLAAAHAADKLSSRELDMAIVGGVDVSIDPLEMVGYAGAGALAPEEMTVYSRLSNGFILGEGCGMIVLKRLEDAERDQNTIYAVLRGWGSSSSGQVPIGTASAKHIKTAIQRAHEGAGYSPAELDFIEGHGSGIADVDRAELEGIFAAIRAGEPASAPRGCGISSIKSLLGHLKGAAGIASLIKATIALNRRVLPPTAGLEVPHALFAATQPQLYPLAEGRARSPAELLRAGVSAIGTSGANCFLTLESCAAAPLERLAPSLEETKLLASHQDTEIFLFAAGSRASLLAQLEQVAEDAEWASLAELTDLAAALATRLATNSQTHFRAAIVAHTPEALVRSIRAAIAQVWAADLELEYRSLDQRIWLSERVEPSRVGYALCEGSLLWESYLEELGVAPSLVVENAAADEFTIRALSEGCDLILELGCSRKISLAALEYLGRDNTPCLPIESREGNDRDRNVVLAALFAGGHSLAWTKLYEHRLVRTFVPARERAFFRNPCEKLFAPNTREHTPPAIVKTDWGEQLGVSSELLQDYLEKRGAVLTELIRADLKLLEKSGALRLPDSFQRVPSASEQLARALGAEDSAAKEGGKEKSGGDDIEGAMIKLIIEKTGYPESSISLESRLLDDLNLDSIKAAEVVGSTAQTFGADGQLDASMFANASIREIAGAIRAVKMNEGVDLTAREDGPRLLKPSELADAPWVRNFASGILIPAPLPPDLSGSQREEEDWTSAVVLILADREEANPHAKALADAIGKLGATVSIWPYSAENALERGRFSHIFAVLPSSVGAPLPELAEHLRAAAAVSAGPNRFPRQRVNALTLIQLGDGALSGIVSFAASVHLERSRQRVRVVEVSTELSVERAAEAAIRETEAAGNWGAAGYDAKNIRRELRCRLQDRSAYSPRAIVWSGEDVVLATGGARGITAECALAFAKSTGVKLALLGNTVHKPGDPHPTQVELDKNLARAAEAGIEAKYYSADVADEESLRATITKIEHELGAITGVIHGAGINVPKAAEQLSTQDAIAQLEPKVQGAINLTRLLDASRLKIFSALTSIIGVAGIQGNAWYALSNELTELCLRDYQQKTGVPVLAAAYGIWSEVGMGARLGAVAAVEKLGTAAIPPREGAHRFVELMLNDPGCRQVVVVARLAALDTWRTDSSSDTMPRARRYLEKIMRAEAGVDLVARTHLDLERDPYLRDHTWSGSPLFPAVFGIEAMAQAAAYVTGRADFAETNISIENLRFQRPIIVHPEYGAEIQVSALVIEQTKGEALRVSTRVTCKQLGFKTECFSGTFVIDTNARKMPRPEIAGEKCGRVRPEDFYGSHLFHGPDYRRIVEVDHATRDRVDFRSEYDVARAATAAAQTELFTRDPFFLDTLLHGMAIGRLESVALPTGIDRITLDFSRTKTKSAGPVQAIITDVTDDEYRGTAIARDDSGFVFAAIEGVRLQAVEHRERDKDTTEQDAAEVRRALNRAATALQVATPPAVELAHTPGIHELSREKRRERELPLLTLAADRWQRGANITWAASGKPMIAHQTAGDISLSHDGDLCLAVAGPAPQGCDLLIAGDRSPEQWLTMLGHRRRALLNELAQRESPSLSGARIWAALEAARKTGRAGHELRVVDSDGVSVLLETRDENMAPLLVLTTPVSLAAEKNAMIAVVVVGNKSEARLAG